MPRNVPPNPDSAANVFKFCTGLKILGSFMILVVLAIVGVSYYAVVICTYGPDLLKGGSLSAISAIVLALFHSLLVMLLWCYFATVFTDPGGVPDDWTPFGTNEVDLEAGEKDSSPADTLQDLDPEDEAKTALMKGDAKGSDGDELQERDEESRTAREGREGRDGSVSVTMTSAGPVAMDPLATPVEVRRCKKCLQYKPPRAHHCSVCRRCILKMDHHCVWVVNCVGAKNYKSFILFMFYTLVECLVVTLALLPRFIAFFSINVDGDVAEPGKLAAVFLSFVLNFAFTLSLLGFIGMHVSLVLSNTTTIEAFEKSKAGSRWKFDMGRQRNIEQVMGRDKRYWPVPFYSQEDLKSMPELTGLQFPCRAPPHRQMTDHHPVHALSLD